MDVVLMLHFSNNHNHKFQGGNHASF